ncbi:MAG: cell division protein ZapE [Pantoea sp. Brub]|nr:cell division protein ZapE [Pantoea sp. Brub]
MQKSPLIIQYKKNILQGNVKTNDIQYQTILKLDCLRTKLLLNKKTYLYYKIHLRLLNFIKKTSLSLYGIYIWGNPGCGKTWLMKLFFDSIPGNRKLYFQYYHFMTYLHNELIKIQGQYDPLLTIIQKIKTETDILCLDEFSVPDVSDARIIGPVIIKLFESGIMLVITSNIEPNKLYHNGLQNTNFSITIQKIQKCCEIVYMNSIVDYRLYQLDYISLWKYPINDKNNIYMDNIFNYFSGSSIKNISYIKINHRYIELLGNKNKILAVNFNEICGEERNQEDYMELSNYFYAILLYNVPIMRSNIDDKAKRFLLLIDELYNKNIILIVSAEINLSLIYQGTNLKFEYQRCLSRLNEMQSKKYLNQSLLFKKNPIFSKIQLDF